jgi:hypothetical protein
MRDYLGRCVWAQLLVTTILATFPVLGNAQTVLHAPSSAPTPVPSLLERSTYGIVSRAQGHRQL